MNRLLILFLIFSKLDVAAQDTIWYDVSKEINSKKNAWYYQLDKYSKNEDGKYLSVEFWLNNKIKSRAFYKNQKLDTLHGLYISWYENGQVQDSGLYISKKKNGIWKYFFANGQLSAIVNYKDNEPFEEQYWDSNGEKVKNIKDANSITEFKGGMDNIPLYIEKHLKYPSTAKKNRIQGKVIVGFVIDEEGNVINSHIIKGIDPELDKEAIRVIAEMPKWKPGKFCNRHSKVRFILPIEFKICRVGKGEFHP